MARLGLVTIDNRYIDHLREYDRVVFPNMTDQRKSGCHYMGVPLDVLNFDGEQYFVPFSSSKTVPGLKKNYRTEICVQHDLETMIRWLVYNGMIPAPKDMVRPVNLRKLLHGHPLEMMERFVEELNKKQDEISDMVKKVYLLQTSREKLPSDMGWIVDFRNVERAMQDFVVRQQAYSKLIEPEPQAVSAGAPRLTPRMQRLMEMSQNGSIKKMMSGKSPAPQEEAPQKTELQMPKKAKLELCTIDRRYINYLITKDRKVFPNKAEHHLSGRHYVGVPTEALNFEGEQYFVPLSSQGRNDYKTEICASTKHETRLSYLVYNGMIPAPRNRVRTVDIYQAASDETIELLELFVKILNEKYDEICEKAKAVHFLQTSETQIVSSVDRIVDFRTVEEAMRDYKNQPAISLPETITPQNMVG